MFFLGDLSFSPDLAIGSAQNERNNLYRNQISHSTDSGADMNKVTFMVLSNALYIDTQTYEEGKVGLIFHNISVISR